MQKAGLCRKTDINSIASNKKNILSTKASCDMHRQMCNFSLWLDAFIVTRTWMLIEDSIQWGDASYS